MSNLFEGIDKLEFTSHQEIIAMISNVNERVQFIRKIDL